MEILNYDEQPAGSKTVALFDIYIPAMDMTLARWKVLRGKDGGHFFVSPSWCKDDAGNKTFHPYVALGEKRRSDFMKQLHEAIKPFLK